jgi:hypothetical protein
MTGEIRKLVGLQTELEGTRLFEDFFEAYFADEDVLELAPVTLVKLET